jgi:hypothetical protein
MVQNLSSGLLPQKILNEERAKKENKLVMAAVASNGELPTISGKLLGRMVLRMTAKMLGLRSLKVREVLRLTQRPWWLRLEH